MSISAFFAATPDERTERIVEKVNSTIEYYASPTYLSGPNAGQEKSGEVKEAHVILADFVTDLFFGDGYETDHVFADPAERLIFRLRVVERSTPDAPFDEGFATFLNMEWQDYQESPSGGN